MATRRGITVGLAALFVASAALGALGLAAVAREAGDAEARLRADALEAVAVLGDALEAELAALGAGELDAAIALELDANDVLVPLLEQAPELRGAEEPGLWRFQEQQVDAMLREGRLDAALDRLARLEDDEGTPWLSAWATTTRAALARQQGDAAVERAALERLAALPADLRDARRLSRALAARARLAELDAASFDERLALYRELLLDHGALEETATAALAARVRAALTPPDSNAAQELAELDMLDAERARRRSLAASDAPAALYALRPGEMRVVEAPPDPLEMSAAPRRWVVARAPGEPPRGYALEFGELLARVLAQPELAVFERAGLALTLGADSHAEADRLATRALPLAGAPGLEARANAVDLDALIAAERRRFWLIASLAALALVVVALAGFATTRAVARESRAAREREAFVATVSHELRTPLAATRLLAELLARGDVEQDKVVEFARRIGVESERLSQLVASILDLARLERGDASAREPLELGALAREAVLRFEPIAREAGYTIELHAGDAPLHVRGERDALIGAVLNLLDNAKKHSDAPHAIELRLERADGRARLTVLDRGRGVPAAERERIFQPFARLGDELTRDRPGAGLGLALVQRIARGHGGAVRCAPRAGGGSAFTLELPLAEEEPRA
jgi:signal transduction histidine kinase